MTTRFWTPGAIPLTSFTLVGANVKTTDNPIGQFGTGLKYAVAVILRHGGKIRMFIEGVEYEFVVTDTTHRDRVFQTVRLRKRHGTLARWMSVTKLPFTLDYGRNWSLWQAYRELESNTRDERGHTFVDEDLPPVLSGTGTLIEIDCPGFEDAVRESETFFDRSDKKLLYSGPAVDIFEAPSNHLYYRGIRVYELRYPARLTYDFKYPWVSLTEDRTAANAWAMMYTLSGIIQADIQDVGLLRRMLNVSHRKANESTFETMELNFEPTSKTSEVFRSVAGSLGASGTGGRSVSNFYRLSEEPPEEPSSEVSLPNDMWDDLIRILESDNLVGLFGATDGQRLEEILDAVKVKLS